MSGRGSLNYNYDHRNADQDPSLEIMECLLSAEMTDMLWSYFSSFTTLHHLIISDSSLSFPPSPPELPSVTQLTAKRVTSQSYEGLLSSLPGLEEINITFDDAESDITQITAGLRRTGGQQLKRIRLEAPPSLPSERMEVSRETMRGLGLLIREQTKNLQRLYVFRVKCRDEEDLIDLVECCRHVKTMEYVLLVYCGTKVGGRLQSHLKGQQTSIDGLQVKVYHNDFESGEYIIYHAV